MLYITQSTSPSIGDETRRITLYMVYTSIVRRYAVCRLACARESSRMSNRTQTIWPTKIYIFKSRAPAIPQQRTTWLVINYIDYARCRVSRFPQTPLCAHRLDYVETVRKTMREASAVIKPFCLSRPRAAYGARLECPDKPPRKTARACQYMCDNLCAPRGEYMYNMCARVSCPYRNKKFPTAKAPITSSHFRK